MNDNADRDRLMAQYGQLVKEFYSAYFPIVAYGLRSSEGVFAPVAPRLTFAQASPIWDNWLRLSHFDQHMSFSEMRKRVADMREYLDNLSKRFAAPAAVSETPQEFTDLRRSAYDRLRELRAEQFKNNLAAFHRERLSIDRDDSGAWLIITPTETVTFFDGTVIEHTVQAQSCLICGSTVLEGFKLCAEHVKEVLDTAAAKTMNLARAHERPVARCVMCKEASIPGMALCSKHFNEALTSPARNRDEALAERASDAAGLFGKYQVRRTRDGKLVTGPTFVLKPITDLDARVALRIYAERVGRTRPELSLDIFRLLKTIEGPASPGRITSPDELAYVKDNEIETIWVLRVKFPDLPDLVVNSTHGLGDYLEMYFLGEDGEWIGLKPGTTLTITIEEMPIADFEALEPWEDMEGE